MKKTVILDALTLGNALDINKLSQFGEVEVYVTTSPSEVETRIASAHIVITNKVLINEQNLKNAPHLQLICIAATGMNNVDLVAAKNLGIEVKNVKNYSTNAVAQHVFAMLLSVQNSIQFYDQYVKQGVYIESPIFTHLGPEICELNGKVMGIIGLGEIGKKVAQIAQVFGMKVIYFSTSGKNQNNEYQSVTLDEILTQSDVLSIHSPLYENTINLLTYSELCKMKKTAILINTSRGGIVNHTDLARALNENLIRAACIDVFEKEPITNSEPLLDVVSQEKLILSPHVAWAAKEARERLFDGIIENINVYLEKTKSN